MWEATESFRSFGIQLCFANKQLGLFQEKKTIYMLYFPLDFTEFSEAN